MAGITFRGVTKQFDDGTVAVDDLDLEIHDGEFMIFVGPSGCGKTTALRMVAGLEHPTSGEIVIGDKVVNDLDPVDRDTAMVFQNYALYPHMTVRDNIGFPLRMQNVPKAERKQRVESAAALLGIGELLERKPGALSGGQRQRVAMGRAIIRHPTTFLMDEPLSNLDAKLRVQMRAELVKLHQRLGVTTLYVTHDQTEAMTLGERVAVLNRGVIQQVDTPGELYNRPANTFVATFIGSPAMNFLRARLSGGALEFASYRLALPASTLARVGSREGDVLLGLRPEHFFDTRLVSSATDRSSLPVTVELIEQLGSETLLYFRADGIDAEQTSEGEVELDGALVARLDPRTQASPGERLVLGIDAERAHLFDAGTGTSL
ncbi:MAG: ABC transporter ATP-binding protein [Gaiella sp.]